MTVDLLVECTLPRNFHRAATCIHSAAYIVMPRLPIFNKFELSTVECLLSVCLLVRLSRSRIVSK